MTGFFDTSPATTTQTTNQTNTANPWDPAQGLLKSTIGDYSGLSTAMTPQQQAASANLWGAAGALPNMMPSATGAVQGIFNNAGMIPAAYSNLQTNLSGLANPANLNPYQTPGFSDALNTLTSNITNQVKGSYAASGRSPSGAGTMPQTLARGLMQGEAPIIQSQYNQNAANLQAANQALMNAGLSSSQGMSGNMLAGLQGAGALTSLGMAPATAQWGAANAIQGQPFANVQPLLGAATNLGGMGGTTTGQATQVGTQMPSQNMFSNVLGDISSLAGIYGGFQGSDRRMKTDIKDIGRTHDNQKIYSYRFKGSNMPQIGMMADEIAKKEPKAVITGPDGMKAVRYDLATRKAAQMGMLSKAA